MELPHPALSAAIVLLLGGAGLIASRERQLESRGAVSWLGIASVAIAFAVWMVSVANSSAADPGDGLFLPIDDPLSQAGVRLLCLAAFVFLAIPLRGGGRVSDVEAGFLLISAAAGTVMLSSTSLWLLFLMAEIAWWAARLATRPAAEAGDAPRIEWRCAAARAVLLGTGLGLIAFATGAHDLRALTEMFERAAAFPDHDLLDMRRTVFVQAGLTLVFVSLAWRMRMFPFAVHGEPGESSAPARLIATLTAGAIAPRLALAFRGFEEWSAVLLCAFGVPTVLARIARGTRPGNLRDAFDELLTASVGLVWLSATIPLYDLRHGLELAANWGSGTQAPTLELATAVCSWLLLNATLALATSTGQPIDRAGDLNGWLRGAPLLALLFVAGILNWGGFPGTLGGAGRAGMLSGLAQVGASTFRSADGFMLLALLVLYAQFRLLVVAVRLTGFACGGRSYRRSTGGIPVVAWLALGTIAAAIVGAGTTGSLDGSRVPAVTGDTTAPPPPIFVERVAPIGTDSDRPKGREAFYR